MKKIIALLLVTALAVSGCNLFKKDPQKAVREGIEKFSEVKKMNSLLTVKGLIQSPGDDGTPSKVEFNLNTTTKSDVTDKTSPKIASSVKAEVTIDGAKGSGEAELWTVDKKLFVNLTKIEIPGMDAAALQTQLASVLSTWWSMPFDEKDAGNPLGKFMGQNAKIEQLAKEAKFLTNAKEDGEEAVQGIASTRYRVDLDKEELKKFILTVARESGNALSPSDETAIADSLKDMEFSGAVWIGEDGILHRFGGTLTITPQQGPTSSFDINYTAWDYGKDVQIAAPEKSQEFNPLMLYPLLGAFGGLGEGTSTDEANGGLVNDQPLGAGQVAPRR